MNSQQAEAVKQRNLRHLTNHLEQVKGAVQALAKEAHRTGDKEHMPYYAMMLQQVGDLQQLVAQLPCTAQRTR